MVAIGNIVWYSYTDQTNIEVCLQSESIYKARNVLCNRGRQHGRENEYESILHT